MRIAIVSQSYLPIHGGVAEHVHHTAEELRRRGHTVKVITAYFDRGDEYFSHEVIRIGHDLTIPMNGAFVNITVGADFARILRRLEEEHRFDVIHIHAPLEPFLPLVALRAFRAPKVGTFHSYSERSIGYQIAQPFFSRFFASRLSARIAVSEAAKEFITRYFPGDYRVISNGVDISRFTPDVPPIERFADGHENILFVGRMDPRKGLKYLLWAFPKIAAARPKARLIVVGGGFLAGYYKRLVPSDLRDRVFFEGFSSSENLPHYYASANVYCSPATSSESFGIVLIEAMASGRPVVAFDNRGYRGVLDGEPPCGILVPNRNIDELANALIRVLGNSQLQRELGNTARQAALRYSWVRVTNEIEDVYRSVMAEAHGVAPSH